MDVRHRVGLATAAVCALAVALIATSGVEKPPLGAFESGFDVWIAWGDALHQLGTRASGLLRLTAAGGGVLALAASFRSEGNASALRVSAALCVGWLAQFDLVDGRTTAAVAQYALAIALYLWASPAAPSRQPLTGRTEAALAITAIAIFVGLCVHEIHIRPDPYIDEGAYESAARMMLGVRPEGPIGGNWYRLERFLAQPIPLALHAAAIALLPDDAHAPRAVSIVLGAATLFVMWIGLRGVYGSAATVTALALAAASPLFLAYSRPGFYIALTVLHGAGCFVALLRFRARWDARSAIVLGGLVGASIYLYQLSWFAPVLVGLSVLVWPDLFRRPGWTRVAAIGCGTAVGVALPWLALPSEGLRQLGTQTFDKIQTDTLGPGVSGADLLSPPGMTFDDARTRIREHIPDARTSPSFGPLNERLGRPLSLIVSPTNDRRAVARIRGRTSAVQSVTQTLLDDSWQLLRGPPGPPRPLHRLRAMVSILFARASWESHQRFVDRAVLNPILAPLLILGLVSAVRFGRDPSLRVLAVWVVAAGLLPAWIGGEFPRRAALTEPFQHLLAAMALLSALPRPGTRGRSVAVALLVALVVACASIGSHLSDAHWVIRVHTPLPRLAHPAAPVILREAGDAGLVLASRIPNQLRRHLLASAPPGARMRLYPPIRPLSARFVLRETCGHDLPLSWVVPETEDGPTLRRILRTRFEFDTTTEGDFAIVRVRERRIGACREQPAAPREPQRPSAGLQAE